jgi:molybdenum-dependent DNA-binding transcriptional regulator ModE
MVCPEATANSLSLRHVLRVVHVAEGRSISAAANELNCSSTAVAKSVSEIERLLGAPLFDRGGGVYRATPSGEILARRGRTAWQIYQSTSEAYRRPRQAPHALPPISNKRIDVLLAVYAQRHLRRAAHELQITENAVNTAVNTLETLLDAPLFERARSGQVIPTYFADVLARNAKLREPPAGSCAVIRTSTSRPGTRPRRRSYRHSSRATSTSSSVRCSRSQPRWASSSRRCSSIATSPSRTRSTLSPRKGGRRHSPKPWRSTAGS